MGATASATAPLSAMTGAAIPPGATEGNMVGANAPSTTPLDVAVGSAIPPGAATGAMAGANAPSVTALGNMTGPLASPTTAQGNAGPLAVPAGDMTDILDIKPVLPATASIWTEWQPWAALAAVALLLALLAFWLWRRRKPKPVPPPPPPHETAAASLDLLERERGLADRDYYFRLSAVLRAYLDGRFGIAAMEMTADELLPRLNGLPLPSNLARDLRRLVRDAEPIKFSDARAPEGQRGKDLALVRDVVTRTRLLSDGGSGKAATLPGQSGQPKTERPESGEPMPEGCGFGESGIRTSKAAQSEVLEPEIVDPGDTWSSGKGRGGAA